MGTDRHPTVRRARPLTRASAESAVGAVARGARAVRNCSTVLAMDRVRVQHFSDVLCVWAYISQVRVEELLAAFGDKVILEYHFVDVFGDRAQLEAKWRDRGGLAAYSKHVKDVVAQFDHIDVHPDVWTVTAPRTSMSCHIFLRAVGLLDDPEALPRAAWEMRRAFFRDCRDVSSRQAQLEIAEQLDLDRAAIEVHLSNGLACAALSGDLRIAREHAVKVSPTFVLNEGRQRLAGNVGYKVIEANLRELLANPGERASWC